ncbi:MAG TPA: tannase/feruloyl esterase family alpha/beta hydrolase [Candidatus Acidoferrales bacterium]|jgi:hypothetical protein|nr:tannase/feruloyl esterase family alpha/beta hydrolase [Candidatus Acidoferrales bacterium]
MKLGSGLFAAAALLALAAPVALVADTACEALAAAALPHTTMTAQSVSAGTFAPPYGSPADRLPAFCRVAGVIKPSSDSYIRFEVWLPASGWNGRFLAAGNGGFAGSIDYNSLARNLRRGYATAATDTGHEGDAVDASWAFKHPEKIVDFGYRALHQTVVNAKSLIQAFYTRPAQHSYFDSCSDGGREALMEAQRFPEDFDGILAGAPANYWTHMLASGLDLVQALYGRDPASYISSIKVPAINAAVLAACDAQDGVKDGIVNDPPRCRFDPAVLLCKDVESRDCLTAPEVASLKRLYAGTRLFPGVMPGGETGGNGWGTWILGAGPGGNSGTLYLENYFRYMVFDDPAWNPLTASADAAAHTADERTGKSLNAIDPDLGRFRARGGKLILYHGWNDPGISPLNTINYYNSVAAAMGAADTESFVRLYMAPGVQHCGGGPGPNAFGQLGLTTAKGPEYGIYAALEQWVEAGAAPGEVIATKYVADTTTRGVVMTRKLCPYPQVATYKGTGDTNDYSTFSCTAPGPGSAGGLTHH